MRRWLAYTGESAIHVFKDPPMPATRRDFLKASAVFAAPLVVPSRVFGANERVSLGYIGMRNRGPQNLGGFRKAGGTDTVAFCDVDADILAEAVSKHGDSKVEGHGDYRELLDRSDIDAVVVSTPDHWHALQTVDAARAGKDVYCEKPLTLTIDEGKMIREVQKETGAIVQVGTQQRSTYNLFVKALALVNEGRVGKIHHVQAAIGGAPASGEIPVAETPEKLDWDRWLGPAPKADYRFVKDGKHSKTNCHAQFRWWYEYSGGKLTDWGAHHVDIANWALHLNGQTDGPTGISGSAEHPVEFKDGLAVQNDRYNTATKFNFELAYPGDTRMTIRNDTDNGVLIEGSEGRIFVSRGKLAGAPVEALKDNPLPDDAIAKVYRGMPVQFNERKAHWANFLHCVRERIDPISDVHSHMDGLNLCHLAGIAARTGRDLKWNATDQTIVGDEQAASMLSRPYREGYEIEMGVVAG